MANVFTTTFVNTPIEKLFEKLILGATSFDKGVAQILEGYQTNVALNRFQATGDIELRNATFGAGTLGDFQKNEKAITMAEMQLEFEIDPMAFNLDHKFLWGVGPEADQRPSPALEAAVMSVVSKQFNNKLETLLWQGGLTGITGWEADIIAADVAGNTVTVTAQGAVTPANVIGILEDVLAAAPASLRELGNPSIITTPAVKYAYLEAQRALSVKGSDITEAGAAMFGGYPIISTHGMSANNIYFLNAGTGDDSELKAAVWATSDRFNVIMAKQNPLDDTFGVKISFAGGTGSVYNGQTVSYLPA